MRAVVKEKQGSGVSILDVERPQVQSNEVLVKVAFAGICGSDLHIYEWSEGYDWLKLPLILGHEFSGKVVETGTQVQSVKIGDKVTVTPHIYCGRCYYCKTGRPNLCKEGALKIGFTRPGAFAEFVAVPESSVFILPKNYPFDIAALTEPFCVALYAVEVAKGQLENNVLVMGPGPIGLMLVKILKSIGVPQVFITGLSEDKDRLTLARKLGADRAIIVDKENPVEIIKEATDGIGVDAEFEVTGSADALIQGTRVIKKGGRVFMIGLFGKPTQFFFTPLVRAEIILQGIFNYTPGIWKKAISLLAAGEINLNPFVTHRITIDEIEKGFELLRQKEAIKILLTI